MSATNYLLDFLVRTQRLSAAEADRVRQWSGFAGLTGCDALTRAGVLRPAAGRTLQLMQKGFITDTDPGVLFASDGLERLKAGNLPGLQPAGAPMPAVAVDAPTAPLPPGPLQTGRDTVHDSGATDTREAPQEHQPPPTDRLSLASRAPAPSRPALSNSGTSVGVGKQMGKCLLTGIIGKGGRGVVYSALHTTLNIPVAVKVLSIDESDEAREELRHEAQLLARLGHPNIVRVLDFECEGTPYVVMEMVEGASLADLIVQSGGLRAERAAEVILQTALGLAAAWELKIVHRDIKPANILLTRDGGVRIADLGLALAAGTSDATNMPLGTCAYMAPEQARSADTVDFRADQYALGATLYHTVTGQLPFAARSAREMLLKHATAEPVPAHEVAPGLVPPELSAVITRMMAKRPDDRFPSYSDLIAALRPFVSGQPLPTTGPATQLAALSRPTTIMNWLFRRGPAA